MSKTELLAVNTNILDCRRSQRNQPGQSRAGTTQITTNYQLSMVERQEYSLLKHPRFRHEIMPQGLIKNFSIIAAPSSCRCRCPVDATPHLDAATRTSGVDNLLGENCSSCEDRERWVLAPGSPYQHGEAVCQKLAWERDVDCSPERKASKHEARHNQHSLPCGAVLRMDKHVEGSAAPALAHSMRIPVCTCTTVPQDRGIKITFKAMLSAGHPLD